jgi:hypothetical protein
MFPVVLPGLAAGDILRIFQLLAAALDDQEAILDGCVLRLIPLQFAVADEADLIRPDSRIGPATVLELIGPKSILRARTGEALQPRARVP